MELLQFACGGREPLHQGYDYYFPSVLFPFWAVVVCNNLHQIRARL